MKTKRTYWLLAAALLLSTLNLQLSTGFTQGTAFTYQGRLNDGANVANGIYDLRFAIYNALNAGTQQGNLVTNAAGGDPGLKPESGRTQDGIKPQRRGERRVETTP